jgi:cytochrome P450
VIADMLGVPTSDRPLFKRWADGLLRRPLSDAAFFGPAEEQCNDPEFQGLTHTVEEMWDYFRQMLEERTS